MTQAGAFQAAGDFFKEEIFVPCRQHSLTTAKLTQPRTSEACLQFTNDKL